MRTFYALLIITTTLCVSSDAALAITSLKEEKFASSNTLLWNQPTPAGESGLVARRSLRAHDADKEDNIAPAEAGHEEERGILPKPAELMKKLDLDDIMEATIVRSIMKGHAPAKTLDKMGVKPSFVTAEGQRAYSKYDKGYQTYRGWVRWVEDNADWLVKELKASQAPTSNHYPDASLSRPGGDRCCLPGYQRSFVDDHEFQADQALRVEVTSHRGPSQRLLRTHHATDVDDEDNVDDEDDEIDEDDEDEDEERALTTAKMWRMKGDKMSAQGYAEKLGIWNKINSNMRPGEYQQFLRTHRYQKYKTYFNFLKENK